MSAQPSSKKRKLESGGPHGAEQGKKHKQDSGCSKYRSQAAQSSGRASISASGLQSGDVGIFVTSDIGKEKAALRELEDLLGDYLEHEDLTTTTQNVDSFNSSSTLAPSESEATSTTVNTEADIESSIQSELTSLQRPTANTSSFRRKGEISSSTTSQLNLITIDIPCVSFVRFPSITATASNLPPDPVTIVLSILRSAYTHPSPQRSRFIKRLTPITVIRKCLKNGVEALCDEVLPTHFVGEEKWKFAVRASVRNNNQMGSRGVIDVVAGKVAAMGGGHKVDLKGYEKLVLVEVYRNVVGMGVLEVGGAGEWEAMLRKGNLGEVWGEGRRRVEKEGSVDNATKQVSEEGMKDGGDEDVKHGVQDSKEMKKPEIEASI